MMKSKIKKNQILMKGIALTGAMLVTMSSTVLATDVTSLSTSVSEAVSMLMYGTAGLSKEEIKEQFNNTTSIYITNEVQLRALAEYVNEGNDCSGKIIILSNNIVIDKDVEWVPIGRTTSNAFNGTFDGKGYTISGIRVSKVNKNNSDMTNIGLFGYNKGTIKNVNITDTKYELNYELNSEITSSSEDLIEGTQITGYYNLGGISGGNTGLIENCNVISTDSSSVEISGLKNVGGIVGSNTGTIDKCTNNASVQGFVAVGGISGRNVGGEEQYYNMNQYDFFLQHNYSTTAKILNSSNSGHIYALYQNVGGIVAVNYKDSIVQKCYNEGKVSLGEERFKIYLSGQATTVEPENAGGIAGWVSGGKTKAGDLITSSIDGCINIATLEGYKDVGGLVGQLGGDKGGYGLLKSSINYSSNIKVTKAYNESGSPIITSKGLLVGNAGVSNAGGGAILIKNFYTIDENYVNNITDAQYEEINSAVDQERYEIDGWNTGNTNTSKTKYCNIALYLKINKVATGDGIGDNNISSKSSNGQNIIIKYDNKYYCIAGTSNGEADWFNSIDPYKIKAMETIDLEDYGESYKYDYDGKEISWASAGFRPIAIYEESRYAVDSSSSLPDTAHHPTLVIYGSLNENINFKYSEELERWHINYSSQEVSNKIESGLYETNDEGHITKNIANLKYTIIDENGNDIDSGTYINSGKIKVKVEVDKALYTGVNQGEKIYISEETAPSLTMDLLTRDEKSTDKKLTVLDVINNSKTSEITYEYNISSDPIEVQVEKLKLCFDNAEEYYYSDDGEVDSEYSITKGTKNTVNLIDRKYELYIDSIAPTVLAEAYVEEQNSTNIYTSGKEILIKAVTSEVINTEYEIPEIKVSFSNSGDGLYNNGDLENGLGNAKHTGAVINADGTTTWYFKYIVQNGDNGDLELEYIDGKVTDLTGNQTTLTNLNKQQGILKTNDIKVDTAQPKVQIIAQKLNGENLTDIANDKTNADTIRYTFKWSEELKEFTKDYITVKNGEKGEVIKSSTDKKLYTMDVTTSIDNGSEADITVTVEAGTCEDLVGLGNIRSESKITVDKKAPELQGIQASATSDISISDSISEVKEHYKVGDTVKLVATFSENIEKTTTVPTLALQFSESGNAKGTVSPGTISGNKITYTYTITAEDMGTLSVKGFTGTVVDAAGNETIVTKRDLNGNTIIADTEAPTLVGITAIAPDFEYDELLQEPGDTKRYGLESKTRTKNTITIIAKYSENVYNLSSNTINQITYNTAPVFELKFGTGETRTASFNRVEGSKIYYTYDISSGNDGDLSIESLSGTVSDIAGNTCTTSTSLPTLVKYEENISEENKVTNITADTTNPTYTISAIAENKDDNKNTITGNDNYYRKGSIITVTAKTNEYIYKNNNKELSRFAENGSDAPQLKVSFETSGNGVGSCANVEYTNNQTIFTYTYTIKESDNGTLNVDIDTSQGYDIALNGNNSKTQSIDGIIADTVTPVTNFQSWVPGGQYGIIDNQDGTWEVTFSELLYDYNPSTHTVGSSLSELSVPILLVSNDNTTPLRTTVSNIKTSNNKTVITYSYTPYNNNIGPYGMTLANVSDKAGNLFNYKDQTAPVLSNIKVTSPDTKTYKAGEEITIVATFNEEVTGTAPTLQLQFSKSGDAKGDVSQGNIDGNTITYTYTITATDAVGNGDNGVLSIKLFTGTGLKDLSGNEWKELDSVTLTGNNITADTIAPTVTITSDVEITNKEVVTYTFTWSETVTGFTAEDIEVINGSKGEWSGSGKEYTLKVYRTVEGRQIVNVSSGVCEDIAGNLNTQRATYNNVVIDLKKPVVTSKVKGGNYVVDTDSKKSTLKEIIVVDEEISKFEYIWSKSTTIPENGFDKINSDDIKINNDINLEKQVSETGTYYLYMKVTDLAGNTFEGKISTNGFIVRNSDITLTPNTTELTNQDVTVTVGYEEGLTENRKAGVRGKTQSADTGKVIISENGTVYAEATDKAGNKVFKELEIKNIDKVAPEGTITYKTNEDKSVTATISFNEENVIITNNNGKNVYTFTENGEFTFEFKDTAGNRATAVAKVSTIKEPEEPPAEEDKTAPTITFNYTTTTVIVGTPIGATISTNEDAIISYSWDNKTWTSSQGYVRTQSATKTPSTAGTYTLYAKAVDKSSNQSTVQKLEFTVVKSGEDIKSPEVIFEDLPTMQVNGVKYVKVSSEMTTENITNKMDKNALLGKTPGYTKLTSDNKLRTSSEITINGETKYVIVVNGDVNCDGKVTPIDVTAANSMRLNKINSSTIQKLAVDFNLNGKIEAIDITMINSYRLGKIKGI